MLARAGPCVAPTRCKTAGRASIALHYPPAGGGQRDPSRPGYRHPGLGGGRDDVAVDPVERVNPRSSSIPEDITMNASAQPAGSTTRPAAAYRQLMMRGLAPDEAANITAVSRGIPIGATPWTVREISHLLFLRAMHDAGRFGPDDGIAQDA
jgi:hypothetical protein